MALGANRLALVRRLCAVAAAACAEATESHLVEPAGDALTGALAAGTLRRAVAHAGHLMSAPRGKKDTPMNRIVSGMQSELHEAAAVVERQAGPWPRRSPT